jgi:hypothetical protein
LACGIQTFGAMRRLMAIRKKLNGLSKRKGREQKQPAFSFYLRKLVIVSRF